MKVTVPHDRTIIGLIHRTIEFVVREGPTFEAMLMQRESENHKFRFLFDFRSNEHAYYRWKLFSILMGDTPVKWRTRPFRMVSDGPLWRPPPVDPYLSGMANDLIKEDLDVIVRSGRSDAGPMPVSSGRSKSNRKSRNPYLPDAEKRTLRDDLLGELTPSRKCIADAMLFCIDHSEAAHDVVDVISAEFRQNSTLARKVALLYLVSDILHNCSANVPNAWYYRKG